MEGPNSYSNEEVRRKATEVSAEHGKVIVEADPLKLECKDSGTLDSHKLAFKGKASEQVVRETKPGDKGSEIARSKAKGVKRKSLEICGHDVHTKKPDRSTHGRFAEEGQAIGPRLSDDIERIGNGEGDNSRSEKRKRMGGSRISKTYDFGLAGTRVGDWNRDKLYKAANLQNRARDGKSSRPSEEKKDNQKLLHYEVRHKLRNQERLKGNANACLNSDLDRSGMAEFKGDRDGESRTNGKQPKDSPKHETHRFAQRTKSEVEHSTENTRIWGNVKSIGDVTTGKDNAKCGRDHKTSSQEDSKNRRDEAKYCREENERERKHEALHLGMEGKVFLNDRKVSREDKGGRMDKVKRFRAGELQSEFMKEGHREKESVWEDERKHGFNRLPVRDVRHSQLGNGNKSDLRGQDALMKGRGSRHLRFQRLSANISRTQLRKDRSFKANVEYMGRSVAHTHRRYTRGGASGRKESHRRGGQDVKRDAYRPARGLENDLNFVRHYRRIDEAGIKEMSVQKPRVINEGPVVLSRKLEDQKFSIPSTLVRKGNVGPTSRYIRGRDPPSSTDMEGARRDSAVKLSRTKEVEGGSNRRCSSKIVAPIRKLEEQDVRGSVDLEGKATEACEEQEKQELVLQEDSRRDLKDQRDNVQQEQPLGAENVIVEEEAVGAGEVARREILEPACGTEKLREYMSHQNDNDELHVDTLKGSDNGNGFETCYNTEKSRAEGVRTRERSSTRSVRNSLEKIHKDDVEREGAAKQNAIDMDRDVKERTAVEGMASRKSIETQHVKSVKVGRAKKEKSNDLLVRRPSVRADKARDSSGMEESRQEQDLPKLKGSSHSVSPQTQRLRGLPKEPGKMTSPRRFEKDRTDWEKFERERNNTLATFDSRYRRFGGGTSGLGGYSPRRRRSEAAIKTPSPPPRSPERRKPRAWDLPPPGMDSKMVAAISAAHQAAVQHAVVTLATVAPLGPMTVLVSPAAPSASVSRGIGTVPSLVPALLQQVNPAVTAVTLTQATRPLRRLYVGNVPATVSDGELLEFMNAAMLSANANHLQGTKPCINCSVNVEKSYAFAEFITPEDATAALAFDGVTLHGTILKIRRPKDFVLPACTKNKVKTSKISEGLQNISQCAIYVQNGGAESVSPVHDMVSSRVADSPRKVFVGGISSPLTMEKVKEIVTAFGQLKAYHWEVDYQKKPPKAFAFLEYMDPTATLKACAGLNGMRLGTGFLTVVQATPDADPKAASVNPPFYGIPEHAKALLETPTRVLELHNLVMEEAVPNLTQEETEEIIEDIRLECTRFGNVKSTHLVHPWTHPELDRESRPSLGKIDGAAVTHNSVHRSMPQSVPEEIPGEDIDEEHQEVQKDALHETPRSPLKSWGPGLPDATKEQMLSTDGADCAGSEQQVYDGSECPMNEASPMDTVAENSQPVFKEVQKEWQTNLATGAMKSDIISHGHELESTLEQDTTDCCLRLGAESINGDVDVSTREWEILHAGKVYVEFTREESACQAAHSLHGRMFAGHKLSVCYFPLKLYQKKFHKGLVPRTFEEKQALALAVQGHLTAHIKD